MGERKLTEEQYKKLAERFTIAVNNRDTLHVLDQRRAAVLIFSLVKRGYEFWERDLENVMELSGGHYSERAEAHLKEITWVCNELNEGLKDPTMEQYKLEDFD